MKMFLSIPDGKGGSKIYTDIEKAMTLIRQVDNITLQVPKIIYLVDGSTTATMINIRLFLR
jgi:hypothetical protein